MQFVHPTFLWALLFTAVPIIIHLFYFRRYKRLYFSNTKFLQEVKDERSSRNRLKHLLVLLSRILALIFLVLAFAQPFIPIQNTNTSDNQAVSIFIDNSFSMNAEGEGQIVFDEAKQAAKNIVQAYSENNRFQILTQNFEGKHQRLVSKNEALNFIEDIELSPASQDFSTVFERQKSVFSNFEGKKTIYILSDFQNNKKLFENDTSIAVNLLPIYPSVVRNVSIDSVWFDAPIQLLGQSNKLIIKIRNENNEKVSGNFNLKLNNVSKGVSTYEIDANSYSTDTLSFTITEKGWNKGEIALNDYPITFDDDYYFAFFAATEVNVLAISSTNTSKLFNAVFKDIDNVNFEIATVNTVNYSELNTKNLILLDELTNISSGLASSLETFITIGGNIFIAPSNNASIPSYNQLFSGLNIGSFSGVNDTKRDVSFMNKNHPALNDLFEKVPSNLKLPKVQRHFYFNSSTFSQEEKLFSFKNNDIFLSSFKIGGGNLYLQTAPLNAAYSDFTTHPIFAPLIYKMAILGVSNRNISFEINANTSIDLQNKMENNEEVLYLTKQDSENPLEIIPQKIVRNGIPQLNVEGKMLESGFYEVSTRNTDFSETIALNYNRKESKLTYYNLENLKNKYDATNVFILTNNLAQISNNVKQQEQGKTFWKWCIIFTLLFLAIEILLLRLMKN